MSTWAELSEPMAPIRPDDVALRPWSADDLDLLQRLLGDPRMTEYLGDRKPPRRSAIVTNATWTCPGRARSS